MGTGKCKRFCKNYEPKTARQMAEGKELKPETKFRIEITEVDGEHRITIGWDGKE